MACSCNFLISAYPAPQTFSTSLTPSNKPFNASFSSSSSSSPFRFGEALGRSTRPRLQVGIFWRNPSAADRISPVSTVISLNSQLHSIRWKLKCSCRISVCFVLVRAFRFFLFLWLLFRMLELGLFGLLLWSRGNERRAQGNQRILLVFFILFINEFWSHEKCSIW